MQTSEQIGQKSLRARLSGFILRPEPWPWLTLSIATLVATVVLRAVGSSWAVVLGELVAQAIFSTMFARGTQIRLHDLHGLERADTEGAFDRAAAKGILDLRIVIAVEIALVAGTVGAVSVPLIDTVPFVELLVLGLTAALVYLTAVYAAATLEQNVDRLITDNRSAQMASSAAVVEALRTVRQSTEAGGRLVASEIASLRGDLVDSEQRRARREQELRAAAEVQAEADRLAVRPNLEATLGIVGGPFHNVQLTLKNTGMDAFNLTTRVEGRFAPNPAIPLGRIGRDESRIFNLGDVGKFPRDRRVPVTIRCSAFDVAGRPLEYVWGFTYLRSTGLFGVTNGWDIKRVS